MNWQYDAYVLGAIALLIVCSVITRTGYFVLGDYLPLPESVRRALRYAPVAALIAIILPELLPWGPETSPVISAKALAALVAVLAFVRTRNPVLVIVVGMLALWLFRALLA
ncbi:AzlD domain-containing protein [Alcaligenes endophyticus]|uniref:AzlD domain-containing protein n=1 Tax=Alcaligenes endophyticus TaxID=1929088 RepID=A0ABT8EH47_9BURK|nr:AzlD domain-containing protein [Alcaligenes endophyticus]MCX5589723.1 AzlD domain-containing protein [Alcaligenes endophyticus]MDN4120613.1 AzlD domain-containing protein [Alcaligenes endophyticus]